MKTFYLAQIIDRFWNNPAADAYIFKISGKTGNVAGY
jgi:hypothetical protein